MANSSDLLGANNNNLQVQFKMKQHPVSTSGTDLNSKVNLVSIDVNEDVIEGAEVFEMNINIQRQTNTDSVPISIDAIKEMQARLEERLQYLSQIAEETMRLEEEERRIAEQQQAQS